MLRSLLRYARGLGIQTRWLVLQGPPEFFRITKRLHNALHDSPGDGSPLGDAERAVYDQVIRENTAALLALVKPGDIVICHDPQTAGLVPALVANKISVVWRCHIGHDQHGTDVDAGWEFLRRYLEDVPLAVFSRAAYAPDWLPRKRSFVLPPNIDPFSAKNQPMDESAIRAILGLVGIIDDPGSGAPIFQRDDGSIGRVDRKAEVLRLGPPPSFDTPLVVQVSRWDRMKDPAGVMAGFTTVVEAHGARGSRLVLAGPNVRGVVDDPEGSRVLDDVERAWRALPDSLRETIDLAQLPMVDNEENAAIVNALQRHAHVIVQKSLREGFGLTVTEALWKRRAVVASAVGGIVDQIRDGGDGLLVQSPSDANELARVLVKVLSDDELAKQLGDSGYERVLERYLSVTALEHWADLLDLLVGERAMSAEQAAVAAAPAPAPASAPASAMH
jgi:trehalose synthase